MKFSVVVPVYNAEKNIRATIESVRGQSYENWELILVNDGSTDGSGDICNEYAGRDARIKPFHRENVGVSRSRNFGIETATGDYIIFLDSDDLLVPDALEAYDKKLSAHPVDLIISGYTQHFIDKAQLQDIIPQSDWCGSKDRFMQEKFKELFFKWLLHSPWSKVFRRDLLVQHGIRFCEEFSIYEDIEFVLQTINRAQEIAVQAKKVYTYEISSHGSLNTRFHENGFEAVMNCWKTLRVVFGRELPPVEYRLFFFSKIVSYVNQMYALRTMDKQKKRERMIQIYTDSVFCKDCMVFKTKSIRLLVENKLIRMKAWTLLDGLHCVLRK
ncbi:glycosyltransferase family 2 protein [Bariatricus sp. HCP28S3_A7]|uniref:glycosyltransferase family 2 protein n=1 Tax=Bariatricus sp. HCP28S3_A7 TaxID=3438894 RepID=UPI003F8C09CC